MNIIKDLDRTKSLHRLIPNLYKHKSVLYVGARTDRMDYGEEFKNAGYKIDIIEIFKKNVDYLLQIPWINDVYHQDVRSVIVPEKYDIVFWWHGCEHIPSEDLEDTLYKLEKIAKVAVVLGMPWGYYKQRALLGNPNEEHISYNEHGVFEKRGYEVECLGLINVKGSNLTAVKYVN